MKKLFGKKKPSWQLNSRPGSKAAVKKTVAYNLRDLRRDLESAHAQNMARVNFLITQLEA